MTAKSVGLLHAQVEQMSSSQAAGPVARYYLRQEGASLKGVLAAAGVVDVDSVRGCSATQTTAVGQSRRVCSHAAL